MSQDATRGVGVYGDPGRVRALAREADALAGEVRAEATRVRGAREVAWVSTGAERFRRRLEEEADRLDRAARELEQAAESLYRHARECEQRLDEIASAQRWFTATVSSAWRAARSAADELGQVVTPAIAEMARYAPTPGSLAWLDFARRAGR